MVRALLGLVALGLATAPAAAQTLPAGGPARAEVEAIWSGFWTEIILGDMRAAQRYLYSKYRHAFRGEENKTELQDIARQLSFCRIEFPPIGGGEQVLYRITCEHRGEHAETFLLLLRDLDGAWRMAAPAVVAPAGALGKWGPFVGWLVDAESSAPIAGGVVVAVWKFHGGEQFVDAHEAVTGPDGRFEVPALTPPFFNFNIQPPDVSYYAPGYATEHWRPGRGAPPDTLRLRPLKTRQERSTKQELAPPRGVPPDKVPGLVRTLNAERRRLWIEPIGASPGTRVDCPPRPLPLPGRGLSQIASVRKLPNQPRVIVALRDGRSYEAGIGDRIPDVGRVAEVTEWEVSIDNELTDEEQDILWCAGAMPVAVQSARIPLFPVRPFPAHPGWLPHGRPVPPSK